MTIPVHFTATTTSKDFLESVKGTPREGKGLEIACAQLCGITHYRMRGYLTVDTEEEYNEWLASKPFVIFLFCVYSKISPHSIVSNSA